jgi:hypothetical protein
MLLLKQTTAEREAESMAFTSTKLLAPQYVAEEVPKISAKTLANRRSARHGLPFTKVGNPILYSAELFHKMACCQYEKILCLSDSGTGAALTISATDRTSTSTGILLCGAGRAIGTAGRKMRTCDRPTQPSDQISRAHCGG